MNEVYDRVINFMLYSSDEAMYGTAEIEMPEIERMTETIIGAGIAGEVDMPIPGHSGSMEATIKMRVPTKKAFELTEHKAHEITARSAIQVYDPANGTFKATPYRIFMKWTPKTTGLGTIAPNAAMDSELTGEVTVLKIYLDNKLVRHIDKFNFIDSNGKKDVLSDVRKALGLN